MTGKIQRLHIAAKFNILTISLILTTAFGISFYQTYNEQRSSYEDLLDHGISIAVMIAQNSELGLYTEDVGILNELISSTFSEKTVSYIALFNQEEKQLVSKVRHAIDQIPSLSAERERYSDAEIFFSDYTTRENGNAYIDILVPVISQSRNDTSGLFIENGESTSQNLGFVQLGLTQEIFQERIRRSVLSSLLFTACVVIFGTLLTLYITRKITSPIRKMALMADKIAEGGGDLTKAFSIESRDEVGDLATSFNRFIARLREMVTRTRNASIDMNDASDKILLFSSKMHEGVMSQSDSVEGTFQAVQGIDQSIAGIASSTGSLLTSAKESSAATLELGSTIEEIATKMASLFEIVDSVSSSVNEMSQSGKEISENIDQLSASAQTTAASIHELDRSIKEIKQNAEETNQISEEAVNDAEQGKIAVDEIIKGIVEISVTVGQTSTAIEELGRQSEAIGSIVKKINEIADKTSLLSINAAIMAVQAGEHGKGFEVVANEMSDLADRTAQSAGSIAEIIKHFQDGTQRAITAMDAGNERVRQEVLRSKETAAALEKIRTSTLKSTERVSGIVRTTEEQSRSSQQITDMINEITSLLHFIVGSVNQQTESLRLVAEAAETMQDIASQVESRTNEQANGSRQININMENIQNMIESINQATRDQTERTRQTVEAMSRIREISEANLHQNKELEKAAQILSEHKETLQNEVRAFKT